MQTPARTKKQPGRKPHHLIRELCTLAFTLVAIVAFQSLVAKQYFIPSMSMMPNLLIGDRLIVTKYPYGWNWTSPVTPLFPRGTWRIAGRTPQYGDIVVVVPRDRNQALIKRVVALPGDRIAMKNGRIILNGQMVPQYPAPALELPVDPDQPCDPFIFTDMKKRLPSGREICEIPVLREVLPNQNSYLIIDLRYQPFDNVPEVRVPEGQVYLMGDNRDHSADSRVPLEESGLDGPVPLSSISGRAEVVTWSWDGTQGWNPLSWWRALRHERSWQSLRPVKSMLSYHAYNASDYKGAGHEQ